MLRELLVDCRLFLEENFKVLLNFLPLYIRADMIFDDEEFIFKFSEPVKKYFKSSLNELKLYNYILFNSHKYDKEKLTLSMDLLCQLQCDMDIYIEEIFDKLSFSLDMNDKDRFYLPKHEPCFIDDEVINELKLAMLGYSRQAIFDFLIEEKMLSADDVWYLNDLINEFELDNKNYDKSYVRVSSKIYEPKIKEILVPKTVNDFSMLINVHELTHAGVVSVSDNLIGYDVLNNDIPRFYEGVFKMKDDLIKKDIEHTILSKKLLDEYKDEPFLEQIEKYKYYVKKI